MSEVRPRDILLRVGGRTWAQYGSLAMAGAGRHLTPVPITFARADVSTCASFVDSSGNLRTAEADAICMDYSPFHSGELTFTLRDGSVVPACGPFLRGARTNVVLWNRDLTNAAWTPTNITPLKDQTGIDGVASSASKITAGAANGTILQSITLGSSARFQSAYVKRITGSGVVEMTMDNGATWTPIAVTAAWARVTIPTQTLANPIVGFRIVTSGDAIAVDMVQNENGVFPSSPIATTTAAVPRAADAFSVPANFGPSRDLTVLARLYRPAHADASGSLSPVTPRIFTLGTAAPRITSRFGQGARDIVADIDTTVTDGVRGNGSIPSGAELAVAFQFRNLSTGGVTRLDVGSGYTVDSTPAATAFSGYNTQTLYVGGSTAANDELYGVLLDLMFLGGSFTRAEASAVP